MRVLRFRVRAVEILGLRVFRVFLLQIYGITEGRSDGSTDLRNGITDLRNDGITDKARGLGLFLNSVIPYISYSVIL